MANPQPGQSHAKIMPHQSHSRTPLGNSAYLPHTVPEIRFTVCIPRNETARPRSQFLHSCVCERFVYSQDRSAYLAAAKKNKQTDPGKVAHRYMTWKLGDITLWFCFGNNEAAQFHFWENINLNQTFILDSHRPFICSACKETACFIAGWSTKRRKKL